MLFLINDNNNEVSHNHAMSMKYGLYGHSSYINKHSFLNWCSREMPISDCFQCIWWKSL